MQDLGGVLGPNPVHPIRQGPNTPRGQPWGGVHQSIRLHPLATSEAVAWPRERRGTDVAADVGPVKAHKTTQRTRRKVEGVTVEHARSGI
eukprot:gene15638-biopygen10543